MRSRPTGSGAKSPESVVSTITERRIDALRPYEGNARTHSRRQIRQIADSIGRFGFTDPVLIADDDTIIAGHGRVLAARSLGMTEVPTVRLSHMSEAERRAYILADNNIVQNAGWDRDPLAIKLQGLIDLDFDVELTGFSLAENAVLQPGMPAEVMIVTGGTHCNGLPGRTHPHHAEPGAVGGVRLSDASLMFIFSTASGQRCRRSADTMHRISAPNLRQSVAGAENDRMSAPATVDQRR